MSANPRKAKEKRPPSTAIVGANVYRLRVLRAPKLSQQALATLSGVSMETIRLLEQNREPGRDQLSPHMDTVDKIAAALGVETASLFQEATPSYATGRSRHLRSIPGTGDDLPATR